jgi:hypothetical protein
MRTSLTILTLLAAAGTAVAAPTPHADRHHGEHHGKHGSVGGAVQKIVSGNHRRSDSRVVVDMTEHAVSPLPPTLKERSLTDTRPIPTAKATG